MKIKQNYDYLTEHFDRDESKARLALSLFMIGIIIFIINNTVLFFVDEEAYFWPRLCMKIMTDLCWVTGSIMGTKYYPTLRNNLLMPTLIFYLLGDVAVFFSVPVGGVLYAVGHVFMIMAIVETTYLRRWQKELWILLLLLPIIVLLLYTDNTWLIAIGIIYAAIVSAVMTFSLSNRYYWLAGVVFFLSDLTGFMRLVLKDNKYTYVVTTTIYFAAFFMLCISVYGIHRKEVVTWRDLFRLLSDARDRNIHFWVCGHWALGLIKGDRKYAYDHIDLAYDAAKEEEFLMWLKHERYQKEFGMEGGARRFYSEKFGNLCIYPCTFDPDGTAHMMSESGKMLELDEGFFQTVKAFGRNVPCIAPGGQELIKDALGDRKS